MSVTHHGNFEGRNIIRFEDGKTPQWFQEVRPLLSKLRQTRTLPFVDKKIQTSWSSMMLTAMFHLGAIDKNYEKKAIDSLEALLHVMYKDGQLYHTTLIHKEPKVEAFLEDYAFLTQTLLTGYKYTQNEIYLIQAQHFVNKALELFYDKGAWNFSEGEMCVAAEVTDNTYTSSVSIMVENLLSISTLLEDEKYSHFAFKTMEYNSYELGRKPIYYPYMLTQVLRYTKGDRVVKTSLENIQTLTLALAKLKYPYILLKNIDAQDYMVCGEKSCFANTNNIDELNSLIEKSL